MKAVFLGLLASQIVLAAEECPVNKISLARGLSVEVYQIVMKPIEGDTRMDAICLKLGRVSAILRRTQGQLPSHPNTPIPPKEFKKRAHEIEGFCGVGEDDFLPRGLTSPEYLTQGFRTYILERINEQTAFIQQNQDPKESNCPPPTN